MFDECKDKDLTKISIKPSKQSLTNLAEICKKSIAANHDKNLIHKTDHSLEDNIKSVSDEDPEGPDASFNRAGEQEISIETIDNNNFVPKIKENQRRERDSNPRDLAVTSFM